eukprot:8463805-Lingulodinium_polyedra.AAC.1
MWEDCRRAPCQVCRVDELRKVPLVESGEHPRGYASWRAGVRRRVRAGQSHLAQAALWPTDSPYW